MNASARLRDNVAANIAGTAVAAAAAVLSAPLIYRWLGAGAYGLVGVYVLLQTLMPLFDAGITAGLARAVAWHRGRSMGEVRTLVHKAQWPVAMIALTFFIAAVLVSDPVARHLFAGATLPVSTIQAAFCWMAGALAFRLVAGLGRATLMALELQVWANGIQATAAVARTFGALVFATATCTGIVGFFAVQVPISLAEWWSYRTALRSVLPAASEPIPRDDLKRHVRFAFGIAGLSATWLLTSQIDKAVLADRLTLPGYGAYSLGVHVGSVLLLAVATVHGAILPRMTRHFAAGEETRVGTLYGVATSLTVALSCAMVVAIVVGARTLLPSLRTPVDGIDPFHIAWVYAIGNAGAALLAIAYQLQNARGVLRMHAWGTGLQALVQAPLVAWAAWSGDAIRTALVFAAVNWVFVIAWLPLVHSRFLPGGHIRWLSRHLLPTLGVAVLVGAGAIHISQYLPGGVAWGVAGLALASGATLVAAAIVDPDARTIVRAWRMADA